MLGVLLLAFFGCKQEEPQAILNNPQDTQAIVSSYSTDPERASYQGKSVLKFKDEEQFKKFLLRMEQYSQSEQLALIRQFGVESELSILKECKGEIKQLLNTIQNKEEFDAAYEKIYNRYQDKVLFNDKEDAVVYPELRAKSLIEAVIANQDGVYLIGETPIHIARYASYSERESDSNIQRVELVPTSDEGLRNTAYKKNSSRKVIVSLSRDPKTKSVYINCSAQKKVLFWWDNYDTNIHAEIDIDVNVPFVIPKPTVRYFKVSLRDRTNLTTLYPAPFTLTAGATHKIFTDMYEVDDETKILGTFSTSLNETDSDLGLQPRMTGHMKAWSRGISYEGAAETDIHIEFQ